MHGVEIAHASLKDLLCPSILADPYPFFRRLRLEDPVHEDPDGRGWMVSRYDDVAAVLRDDRFSAERLVTKQERDVTPNPVEQALARQMLFLDPPDHTRLRNLFTKAFTPNRVEALKPQVAGMVTELLNNAEDAGGRIDFIQDFCVPVPVTVIAHMLGVPTADRSRLRNWSLAFGKLVSGRVLSAEESTEARDGIRAFMEYFGEMIAVRRQRPEGDLLSDLIVAEEQGDHLSTEELIVNLILLLAAGNGTTTHLLGNGLLALSRHPEQWRYLASDPALALNAVNELLRYDGPVQATTREALVDISLAGKTIMQGQRVTVLLGSANHDEERFQNPDTLDLHRPATRLLSFGHGIHTCLGAALARMEAQVAFGELAHRFPGLEVTTDAPQRTYSIHFRGLQALPVSLCG
jgi:cytochrome P450